MQLYLTHHCSYTLNGFSYFIKSCMRCKTLILNCKQDLSSVDNANAPFYLGTVVLGLCASATACNLTYLPLQLSGVDNLQLSVIAGIPAGQTCFARLIDSFLF